MRKFILLSLVFILGLSLTAFAAIPRLINYQGRLTDASDVPLEGSHDITFRIYDAESGGALLWEETQSVLIQSGVFSILLGGTTDLDLTFDNPYWLAIKVGSDSEMTPRQQIAASGYAMMADDVMSVPAGIITMWSGSIANIPDGWALCDGSNGTPNLTDRFIIHADADSGGTRNVGAIGGSHTHTLTVNEMPSHRHLSTQSTEGSEATPTGASGTQHYRDDYTKYTGGGAAHNNMPKYYALAYIMKK